MNKWILLLAVLAISNEVKCFPADSLLTREMVGNPEAYEKQVKDAYLADILKLENDKSDGLDSLSIDSPLLKLVMRPSFIAFCRMLDDFERFRPEEYNKWYPQSNGFVGNTIKMLTHYFHKMDVRKMSYELYDMKPFNDY